MSPADRVKRMKEEILADAARGVVPRWVRSFRDLHDHVDANMYGVADDEPVDEAMIAELDGAQGEVHDWLASGALAAGRPAPAPGWLGPRRQLLYFLAVVRADRDEAGAFLVRAREGSSAVSSFMGDASEDAEVAVAGDVEYRVGGDWCNLAAGLGSTSYGVRVRVY